MGEHIVWSHERCIDCSHSEPVEKGKYADEWKCNLMGCRIDPNDFICSDYQKIQRKCNYCSFFERDENCWDDSGWCRILKKYVEFDAFCSNFEQNKRKHRRDCFAAKTRAETHARNLQKEKEQHRITDYIEAADPSSGGA